MILVTLHKRPEFTRRTLTALSQCYGIENQHVHMSIDFHDSAAGKEVIEIADQFMRVFPRKSIFVHDPPLGIDAHKLAAFPKMFTVANYVIHLEDDILVAKDFLRYHEWANEAFRDISNVGSVSAYSASSYISLPYIAFRLNHFNCWGWGTWEDRWEEIIGDESEYKKFAGKLYNGMFDHYWLDYYKRRGMFQIMPYLARCQNLVGNPGTENEGVNSNDPHAMENFNSHGAWEYDLPDAKEWSI